MQNQLRRAMELAKKTGDRLIVFDSVKSSEPYVVLSIDEYERLMIKKSDVRGLTEEELLDKINRDIATWKSEQEFFNEYLEKDDYDNEFAEESAAGNELDEDLEEEFYFEPEEYKHFETKIEKFAAESLINEIAKEREDAEEAAGGTPKRFSIPSDRKKAADEVIKEDKNYLEEIGEMPY